nr:TIGR04002 family protein [uncultured Niameybacter sp.]
MKQSTHLKHLVLTGLFAAMIYLTTAFLFHIPTANGGYIHLGDAFIYFAASILPMPYAMVSAAIGAGLSDLLTPGGVVWVIPTIIIKPLLVMWFTPYSEKFLVKRHIIALFGAGVVGLIGYAIASGVIYGNMMAALLSIPMGALQPIGCAILYFVLGLTFDKMKVKGQWSRLLGMKNERNVEHDYTI